MMPNYCNIHHHQVNLYKDTRYMNIYIQKRFPIYMSIHRWWKLLNLFYNIQQLNFILDWKKKFLQSVENLIKYQVWCLELGTTLDSLGQFVRQYCLFHIWSQYLITLGLVNVWCCQQIAENLSLVVSLIVTRSCLLEIVPPLQQKYKIFHQFSNYDLLVKLLIIDKSLQHRLPVLRVQTIQFKILSAQEYYWRLKECMMMIPCTVQFVPDWIFVTASRVTSLQI